MYKYLKVGEEIKSFVRTYLYHLTSQVFCQIPIFSAIYQSKLFQLRKINIKHAVSLQNIIVMLKLVIYCIKRYICILFMPLSIIQSRLVFILQAFSRITIKHD